MGLADDRWFAGFTDGEGCFSLNIHRHQVRQEGVRVGWKVSGVQPWFQIGLREDDEGILRELADEFGGTVTYHPRPKGDTSKRRGRYCWIASSKESLRALVDYFDRFPLRAKKRADYVVWREAVLIYLADGCKGERLPELRVSLMEGRR